MDTYEILSLIIAFLGFIGIIYSLYLTREQRKSEHDWNRRKAAIDYTVEIGTDLQVLESFAALEKMFNYLDDIETVSLSDLESTFKKDPNIRNQLILKLNCFETVAIGVLNQVFDEKIIKDAWYDSFARVDNRFSQFIKARQKDDSEYCRQFYNLYDSWKDRAKKRKGTG